jgi:hypothetical protein
MPNEKSRTVDKRWSSRLWLAIPHHNEKEEIAMKSYIGPHKRGKMGMAG